MSTTLIFHHLSNKKRVPHYAAQAHRKTFSNKKKELFREKMTNQQKENVLKVLDNLLKHSKVDLIREAISKFRTNKKIV